MKFRKICFRETCLERSLTEREKICIDQNGIEEENFEKRRICIGKTEGNSLKLKHLKCVKFIMDFGMISYKMLVKSKLFMVLIRVSKIPTLFLHSNIFGPENQMVLLLFGELKTVPISIYLMSEHTPLR